MKNFYRLISPLLIIFLLTSCVTDFLWGAREYKEEITRFYIGSDGRYVVFMGPEYHYVFTDDSGALRQILSVKQGVIGLAKGTYFDLDNNNNVDGHLILQGSADYLPQEDIIKLQVAGFIPDRKNNFVIKIDLKGRRYSARYLQQVPAQNLSSYFVTVNYRKKTGIGDGIGKAAITPVAVTLDAALLIGKVAIYPFTLPYTKAGIK